MKHVKRIKNKMQVISDSSRKYSFTFYVLGFFLISIYAMHIYISQSYAVKKQEFILANEVIYSNF